MDADLLKPKNFSLIFAMVGVIMTHGLQERQQSAASALSWWASPS